MVYYGSIQVSHAYKLPSAVTYQTCAKKDILVMVLSQFMLVRHALSAIKQMIYLQKTEASYWTVLTL